MASIGGDRNENENRSTEEEERNEEGSAEVVVAQSSSELPWFKRLAYGLGHVQNDLCASMWFTYLIVFLTKVLGFDPGRAGTLVLIGQLTDAIATPLVGLESDRVDLWRFCIRFGRRRLWHIFGTICVSLSFPFLFRRCFDCGVNVGDTSDLVQLLYYTPFVVIFQVGWASVQIAHLALIPELSSCQHERITLNSIRYGFTVISNIAVFVAMWIVLGYDPHHQGVTAHDEKFFLIVAITVVVGGSVFSLIFQIFTKEPTPARFRFRRQRSKEVTTNGDDQANAIVESELRAAADESEGRMTWRHWLKNLQFYEVGLMYMCSRLYTNITQTYLPLYILETQHFNKQFIAIIPLVVYVSGFGTSFALSFQIVSRLFGRRASCLLGLVIGAGACTWLWFHNLHDQIYGVSVLLGISSTILMVTSLAMAADLINKSTESGAFVFGVMSFFDKVSTGVAIQLIQWYQPTECDPDVFDCVPRDLYFRYVMVFVSGGALMVASIGLALLWRQNIGERNNTSNAAPQDGNDQDRLVDAVET